MTSSDLRRMLDVDPGPVSSSRGQSRADQCTSSPSRHVPFNAAPMAVGAGELFVGFTRVSGGGW